MRTAFRNAARTLLVASVVVLPACADGGPLGVSTTSTLRLRANSSVRLSRGVDLTPGSSASWSVSMPLSASTIELGFDGRIHWATTAGNSTVLEITVNGHTVTGSLRKGSSYSYPRRGGTEHYYENRGSAWGQSAPYWGLFWSPDFTQNNVYRDYYYVSGGNAYGYVFDVTGLVAPGQVNTITLANRGGWVHTATGNSPTVVLRRVVVAAR